MPKLSDLAGRALRPRAPKADEQARIQSEAESVADVTAPDLPPGVAVHDEAMAGARRAARPPIDLEEDNNA